MIRGIEQDTDSIKIVAVNSQGYFGGDINRHLSSHRDKPDVFICTEHKQRDLGAISDSLRGYSLAGGYPASTGQRGSAVFVKHGVAHRPRPDLDCFSREGSFEASNVEIYNPRGRNVVVTGVYRSPNSRVTDYNRSLDKVSNYMKKEQDTAVHVFAGDFNIDLTSRRSTDSVLKGNNLRSHIRSATHDGGRCLDNFITPADSGCTGRRLTSTFSDHRPIQLQVPKQNRSRQRQSSSTKNKYY